MDEISFVATLLAALLTVFASIAAALLAGYLVDRKWLKERRLDAYAALMSEVQVSIVKHNTNVLDDEQGWKMANAYNQATLLAPDKTNTALEAAWLEIEVLQQPKSETTSYTPIIDAMTKVSDKARTDVTGWWQRKPRSKP